MVENIPTASQNQKGGPRQLCCTCNVGDPECLLVLWCFGSVLAPLLAARGADAAQVHLGGLEEGHSEGLLVLGSLPPDQPRQLGVDALSCKNNRLVRVSSWFHSGFILVSSWFHPG